MIRDARQRAAQGREIVIFPEGTRRPPGAPPDYKPGFLALYEGLGLPCVPLALNSGLFWPRRSIMRYPGTIVIEILDPDSAGPAAGEARAADPGAHRERVRRLIAEARAAPTRRRWPRGDRNSRPLSAQAGKTKSGRLAGRRSDLLTHWCGVKRVVDNGTPCAIPSNIKKILHGLRLNRQHYLLPWVRLPHGLDTSHA